MTLGRYPPGMRFLASPRIAPLALAATLLIAGCGDSLDTEEAASATTETPATTAPDTSTPAASAKPTVALPSGEVTELIVTDLAEGEGEGAVAGDTVILNYVGVRSADGTEFDNSYDRGQPFPVTLGAQSVIAGWEEGLLGVKAGGQRQLDIPADLAYGDTPQGDIIQPGDALSFVVDVIAILPATDPADAPTVTVTGAANRDDVVIDDLVEGTGTELALGDTAYLHLIAYRGDTGEELTSTWAEGQPQPIQFVEQGSLPGIIEGMAGMKVGGRRQIVIPFVEAFGTAGNPDLGLPADTDLVLIIDLIAVT